MIRILPLDKGDMEACDNMALASDELVIPHIKELLTWLQDMNWPVAKRVSKRLAMLGVELIPALRDVLNGEDEDWKYWLISNFLHDVNDDVFQALFFNIKKIQRHPTASERKALLPLEAEHLMRMRAKASPVIGSQLRHSSSPAEVFRSKNIGGHLSAVSSLSKVHEDKTNKHKNGKAQSKKSEKSIVIIHGDRFDRLENFYDAMESSISSDDAWEKNLDGFHAFLQACLEECSEGLIVEWNSSERSKTLLGYDETVRQLNKRLQKCHPKQKNVVESAIAKAEMQQGLTVFDWIVQIIRFYTAEHLASDAKIELKLL